MFLANKTVLLVCYDIRDPKRWKQVHNALLGFGEPIQLSVFRCILSDAQRVKLREKLKRVIDMKKDSVVCADLGSKGEEAVSTLGIGLEAIRGGAVVV